jgi:hypothetical protein
MAGRLKLVSTKIWCGQPTDPLSLGDVDTRVRNGPFHPSGGQNVLPLTWRTFRPIPKMAVNVASGK